MNFISDLSVFSTFFSINSYNVPFGCQLSEHIKLQFQKKYAMERKLYSLKRRHKLKESLEMSKYWICKDFSYRIIFEYLHLVVCLIVSTRLLFSCTKSKSGSSRLHCFTNFNHIIFHNNYHLSYNSVKYSIKYPTDYFCWGRGSNMCR